jgi:hypothetical protein
MERSATRDNALQIQVQLQCFQAARDFASTSQITTRIEHNSPHVHELFH